MVALCGTRIMRRLPASTHPHGRVSGAIPAVTIDPGVAHVLTNHGTVTAPDVRVVTERDIKRKLPGGKAQARGWRGGARRRSSMQTQLCHPRAAPASRRLRTRAASPCVRGTR